MPERSRPMVSMAIGATVVILAGVVAVVLALTPSPQPDRVQALAERLRCPVCTSVSVAESPSDTAVAMRQVISDQVAAGRTDEEIVAYFRTRYGDWAVIDPPASGNTLLLWLLPGGATIAGITVLLVRLLRRPAGRPDDLSAADRARVEEALDRHRDALTRREVDP